MKRWILASTLAVGICSVAEATIVIAPGPIGAGTLDNVLFTNNPAPGTTIAGVLNSTPFEVLFTGTETLVGNGGQARIDAQNGGFNALSFTLGAGLGFDTAVFNINTTNSLLGGVVTVTAADQFGNFFSNDVTLGNGQNFINLTTLDNQLITSVSLSSTLDFADVRQIRLGDAQTISAAVPEPSTWAMMLIGFAGLGYATSRRNRGLTIAS